MNAIAEPKDDDSTVVLSEHLYELSAFLNVTLTFPSPRILGIHSCRFRRHILSIANLMGLDPLANFCQLCNNVRHITRPKFHVTRWRMLLCVPVTPTRTADSRTAVSIQSHSSCKAELSQSQQSMRLRTAMG